MNNDLETRCYLPASGFTRTVDEAYDWGCEVTRRIKQALPDGAIHVLVWAYREQHREWLAAIFYDAAGRDCTITFLSGYPHNFDLTEPYVPDMTEALHMTGIVADALSATITIGRRDNEVNRYCTPGVWVDEQTNGSLVLAEKIV